MNSMELWIGFWICNNFIKPDFELKIPQVFSSLQNLDLLKLFNLYSYFVGS